MMHQTILTTLLAAGIAFGMQSPEAFATPEQAAEALLNAAQTPGPALTNLFGVGAQELLGSGDAVLDQNNRKAFVTAYQAKHYIAPDPVVFDRLVLHIGENDYPFPVPIVKKNGKFMFDAEAGRAEVRQRIIGAGELDAIEFCRGYVEAQLEYAESDHDQHGVREYAERIYSSPGKHDGLYWDGGDSPLTAIAAKAASDGYETKAGKATPFHGYFFKVLKAQGPDAETGARSYIVQGHMIGGFALVAWPAEYGVSGIMTFIVNQNGVVYEKDLGPQTVAAVQAMKAFNPDKTWRAVPESEP
jgi:hypothetical protein